MILIGGGVPCQRVNDSSHSVPYDISFNTKAHYLQLADGHKSNEFTTARGQAQFIILGSKGKLWNIRK